MAQRHSDALFIQTGAVNAQGTSKALARAYDEAAYENRSGPIDKRGTAVINRDPACQLILHQLCFLAGIQTVDHPRDPDGDGRDGGFDYDAATRECHRLAAPEVLQRYGLARPTEEQSHPETG